MLFFIILLTFICDVFCFHLYMNEKYYATNNQYDYKIPKWAKKRFQQNKIPKFSEYHKKNRPPQRQLEKKMKFISEEEAHYNTLQVCNLPFGLLQNSCNL